MHNKTAIEQNQSEDNQKLVGPLIQWWAYCYDHEASWTSTCWELVLVHILVYSQNLQQSRKFTLLDSLPIIGLRISTANTVARERLVSENYQALFDLRGWR